MESQKILEDFDRWELRAAEASEILAFGAATPASPLLCRQMGPWLPLCGCA